MDVYYPLGIGSNYDNWELRYSLRSLQKYLTGISSVTVLGRAPDWFIGRCINIPDDQTSPAYNVIAKLKWAMENSDHFLWVDDDYYFIKDLGEASDLPYFYQGTIEEKIKQYSSKSGHYYRMEATYKTMVSQGMSTYNFDIHHPVRFHSDWLRAFFKNVGDHIHGPYLFKSLYCNYNRVDKTPAVDWKWLSDNEWAWENGLVISSKPQIETAFKNRIENLLKEPSRWERS